MREYELYLVIDADAEEETLGAIIDRITQLVAVGDGEPEVLAFTRPHVQ